MFFMNGNGTEIINSEFVERFKIDEKDDSTLIIAVYDDNNRPVTLARYATTAEAIDALKDLHRALEDGDLQYSIFPSSGIYKPTGRPKNGYHGEKHRSHGGS